MSHIHKVSKIGKGNWASADLTAKTGAPLAGNNDTPVGFVYPTDSSIHVVYRDGNNHVQELSKVGTGNWKHYDLTAMTGAPVGLSNSPPFGFVYPSDPSMHVVYLGINQHIHELSKVGTGNWGHYDLTAMTGAPLAGSAPTGFANRGDPACTSFIV